jgi:hypothetical protein
MIAEWDVNFSLMTPAGTLLLNQTSLVTGRRFQLIPERCTSGLPVRITEDDMPQFDGKIPHRRWRSGYQCHLAIEPLIEVGGELECAGGEDLVEMVDELGLHFNSMIRTGQGPGFESARLVWAPTGQSDQRMFNSLQLAGAPSLSPLEGALGGALVEVDLDSNFPYYIAYTETDTAVSDASPVTITNVGNTDYYPVVWVYGYTDAWILTNYSIEDIDGNPLQIEYDASLPGAAAITGGHLVELDFFRGTAFLDQDQDNLKAGINMTTSDFFPLIPGDNDIEISGATALVKWNSAWA